MGQVIRVWRKKRGKPKGVLISRRSIGTTWVNGQPFTYNSEKMQDSEIDFDKITSRGRKRRTIYVRRR